MKFLTEIKKTNCQHKNYCVLLDENSQKEVRKVCLDCKMRWAKEPLMNGVKELTHA